MAAGDSILYPRGRGGIRLGVLAQTRRSVIDPTVQDLRALSGPAFDLQDPFAGDLLGGFKAGTLALIDDIAFLAFGKANAKSIAKELRRAAEAVMQRSSETLRVIERTKRRATSAVYARAGAVGFERSGTPSVVARAITREAFQQSAFLQAFALNLAQQLIRKARRLEKKISRRESVAIGGIIRELGDELVNLVSPDTVLRI